MATSAQMDAAVDKGEADTGYDETACDASTGNNTKYGKWYGMNCAAWCAMAVSKWYYDSGAPQPASTAKGFSYTPSGADWYKSKGAWAGPSTNPKRGWVVFFYSNSAGRIAHVGLVRGPRGTDGLIPTVEGNTDSSGSASGGSVLQKRRNPSQSIAFRIAGYGQPEKIDTGEEWWEMPIGSEELKQIRDACEGAVREVMNVSTDNMDTIQYGQVNNNKGFSILAQYGKDIKAWQAANAIPTAEAIAAAVVAELPEGSVALEQIVAAFEQVIEDIVISVEVGPEGAQMSMEDPDRGERLRGHRPAPEAPPEEPAPQG